MSSDVDKETRTKISKLQLLEQRIQSLVMQKQNFQSQLLEIENALAEIQDAQETYKIVGSVMVAVEKDKLEKDLNSKKEIVELKVKNLEKEEKKLREESNELQKEVMGSLKK